MCFCKCIVFSGFGTRKMSGINLIMANFNRNLWSQFISVNKDNFILYFVIQKPWKLDLGLFILSIVIQHSKNTSFRGLNLSPFSVKKQGEKSIQLGTCDKANVLPQSFRVNSGKLSSSRPRSLRPTITYDERSAFRFIQPTS